MARRKILLLEAERGGWEEFLREYFEDTGSELEVFHNAALAKSSFDRHHHEVLFVDPRMLGMNFIQAIKASRQAYPHIRIFATSDAATPDRQISYDDVLSVPENLNDFQRKFLKRLSLPEHIEVLVVDDEKGIGDMIRDFLESRTNPSFSIRYAENGVRGLEELVRKKPDILVLDIKMPLKDGREVYREAKEMNIEVPTIVFFDAISGDEISDVRRYGKAAVIEKGSPQSALPELMELIKKMIYFS